MSQHRFRGGMVAQVIWAISPVTGEIVTALTIGDFTYHEVNGELIDQRVQRERRGRQNERVRRRGADR